MHPEGATRGYLSTLLGCYCPRCRKGALFQHPVSLRVGRNMEMHRACPVCAQPTEIEVGFYYGTGYVSYLIAVAISALSFLLWWLLIGFSFSDRRFFWWLGCNSVGLLLGQPWLMRFSRAFWLSCFVSYDPHWRTNPPDAGERHNAEQANNW
ncbi:DUF983 domain-containing protein [Flaviaesturariibacter amylovorans]|uniref:DUF983 domain-containing protein n=1 Tax=Flaviaesturariibacter amylovorans TaxID=1084520 RepID=A0ABP8G7K2_9BACT